MIELLVRFETELKGVRDLAELEQLRVKFLGKNSQLKKEYNLLREVDPVERPKLAEELNGVKNKIEKAIIATKERLQASLLQSKVQEEFLDCSLPGFNIEVGHLHPLTLMEHKCTRCLTPLGFRKVGGPEVETPFYNFDALCIAEHHPARDAQDTFWLANNYLMRSHTTTVQARVLERLSEQDLPIRIVSPGRVYRNESVDASHLACFHQYEGLCVDYGVKLSQLKWTLTHLLKGIYGEKRQVRFKPKFYPYTEPSLGADIDCENCAGAGCIVCHGSGWVTIVGAGMVHPQVFKNLGYSRRVTGFAFGFGLSRMTAQFYKMGFRTLYGPQLY